MLKLGVKSFLKAQARPIYSKQLYIGNFRSFSNILKPSQPSGFARLTQENEFRKRLLKDVQEQNDVMIRKTRPFYENIYHYAKNNKKKIIFFIIVCAILNYLDAYRRFAKYWRKKEPVKLKLKRWVFGDKNIVPPTIVETFIDKVEIKLKPETLNQLEEVFLTVDKQFRMGVNRRFVVQLFRSMGFFQTPKEITDYYNESKYARARNQKISGVTYPVFLATFQNLLNEAKKKNLNISEDELLNMVRQNLAEAVQFMRAYEDKKLAKRSEYTKTSWYLNDDKQRYIRDAIAADPEKSIEDIEASLVANGFYGLSLKDKIYLLRTQLNYYGLLKTVYVEKNMKNSEMASDTRQAKIEQLEAKCRAISELVEKLETDFTVLFSEGRKKRPDQVVEVENKEKA